MRQLTELDVYILKQEFPGLSLSEDPDIERYLDEGLISLSPRPSNDKINGATIDVRLGNSFRVFREHSAPYIDLSGPKEEVSAQLESVGHIGKQHFGSHKSHLGQTVHFEKLRILHSHLPVIMHYLSLIAKTETNMSFDNNVHKTIPNDCINWLSGECFGIAFATL